MPSTRSDCEPTDHGCYCSQHDWIKSASGKSSTLRDRLSLCQQISSTMAFLLRVYSSLARVTRTWVC